MSRSGLARETSRVSCDTLFFVGEERAVGGSSHESAVGGRLSREAGAAPDYTTHAPNCTNRDALAQIEACAAEHAQLTEQFNLFKVRVTPAHLSVKV